jgi:hypothetical protein
LFFDKCNNKDNIISVEVAKIWWCDVLLGILLWIRFRSTSVLGGYLFFFWYPLNFIFTKELTKGFGFHFLNPFFLNYLHWGRVSIYTFKNRISSHNVGSRKFEISWLSFGGSHKPVIWLNPTSPGSQYIYIYLFIYNFVLEINF